MKTISIKGSVSSKARKSETLFRILLAFQNNIWEITMYASVNSAWRSTSVVCSVGFPKDESVKLKEKERFLQHQTPSEKLYVLLSRPMHLVWCQLQQPSPWENSLWFERICLEHTCWAFFSLSFVRAIYLLFLEELIMGNFLWYFDEKVSGMHIPCMNG